MTAPRVDTAAACSKTIRNRSVEVASFRSLVSGGSIVQQFADEVKVLPQEERRQLIDSGVFSRPTVIPSEDALALKSDLVIPWSKLRAMRR